MKLRVFLVYPEPSTMRIGEAGFEQLANVVSFRAPDFVPLFCRREMLLLMVKNRKMYDLFLPNSLLTLNRINVLKKGKTSTLFLSSPHLCFIIEFICDLFVSRDDPMMG